MKFKFPGENTSGTPENRARTAICEYLDTLKAQGLIDFWVQKNMGTYDVKTERFRSRGKWERPGVPDLAGYYVGIGVALFIEIKSVGKKTPLSRCSPEQVEFIQGATRGGCHAFAAATIKDLQVNMEHPLSIVRKRQEERRK